MMQQQPIGLRKMNLPKPVAGTPGVTIHTQQEVDKIRKGKDWRKKYTSETKGNVTTFSLKPKKK